uniref:Uncharacterized protein n=1 Tax=Junco hyemalis TaxID=40217 RepID=A0A8C5J349_JUNHY
MASAVTATFTNSVLVCCFVKSHSAGFQNRFHLILHFTMGASTYNHSWPLLMLPVKLIECGSRALTLPCCRAEGFSEPSGMFLCSVPAVQAAARFSPLLPGSADVQGEEGTAGSPLTSTGQGSPPAPNVPLGAQAEPLAAQAQGGCDSGAVLSRVVSAPLRRHSAALEPCAHSFPSWHILGSVHVLSQETEQMCSCHLV